MSRSSNFKNLCHSMESVTVLAALLLIPMSYIVALESDIMTATIGGINASRQVFEGL